ncbi:aminotransferase class V-fold PLP-dependent enzyme [Altererythrobacter soli]|uniref:Cysteine desulfurase n=1 Tax=Croceibacterium soli TaxID=1739690 RepID=A0A6I4UUW9_9SPHN|nr:aminotransferase class V-fold PLP-dependent enzyme [Croceibacterium soli]MXP42720.1 aminotransferase class V-fold PLP-dependent enzyme [Croceibacterium soli]
MTRVYLDHAATTPLRPEAAEAMRRGFDLWANPSSPHAEGRAARAALEDARARVKAALGWQGEVIFTSGASEAAALALGQAKAGERLVSAVEHDAVLKAATGATVLPVRPDGALDLAVLERELAAADEPLVAVQSINSETGNRQDLAEIGSAVRGAGGLLLADCAQSAGKFPLPDADMIVISAHKFGGPVGIGALLVKDFAMLHPVGGQERGYRRGTESLPAVLGLAAALEAGGDPYLDHEVLAPLEGFAAEVRALRGEWLSDRLSNPTPYIRAIAMPRLSGSAQLMRFDMAGIAVSQGSACSSGSLRTSHVLEAMALDAETASRTIRVSFGWNTLRAEVERFCDAWIAMARDAAERAA